VLSRNIGNQENSFVIRVQTIRGQHILMREYDRQMIAVLEQRRAAIQAAVLTDASLEEGVAVARADNWKLSASTRCRK